MSTDRGSTWLARLSMGLFGIALGLTTIGAFFLGSTLSVALPAEDFGFRGFTGVFAVAYSVVGWIVASRQPRNAIGWIYLAAGMVTAVMVFCQGYTVYAVLAHPGALPFATWAAWLYGWLWLPFMGLVGIFGIVLFPDGRLLSSRWRAVAWLGALVALVASFLLAVQPGPLANFTMVENPAALDLLGSAAGSVTGILLGLVLAVAGASAVSLVIRFRASTGVARQQLRWIAFSGSLLVITLTAASVLAGSASLPAKIAQVLLVLAVAGVPVAAGIAILRYHLYDLDLIINRTLVYGSVSAVLALSFGVADIGAQRLVEAVSGTRSDVVSGMLGVAAAVAFGPMRRAARPIVDRVLPSRAMLALVFSDVVDSTGHIVKLGDERWRVVLDRYQATVRQDLARFGGRVVDMAGDGFFAYFHRPIAALGFAWSLREGVRGLDLQIRTGIHLGECEMRGEEPSGLAVHAAQRVMSAAGGSQIFASEAIVEAVAPDGGRWADMGEQELKGVPGAWRLFALEELGQDGRASAATSRAAAQASGSVTGVPSSDER
jgi:class 3 adenylate cyclase